MRTFTRSVPSFEVTRTLKGEKRYLSNVQWACIALTVTALFLLATAPSSAQCTSVGDYTSVLSNACDSCTSSCDSLASAGAGCGPLACGGAACGGGLLDYVFGNSNACGGSCSGSFWSGIDRCGGSCDISGCGIGSALTSLLFGGSFETGCGSVDGCCDSGLSRGDGCGLGLGRGVSRLLAGCCGNAGCGGCEPGAGYVGEREAPIYCGMPAPSYPVPYAVPQHVGVTHFTYPPFMPHHSLPHYRHVYSYRHAPGMSRTNVHWRAPIGRDILAKLHNMIELPR